MLNRSPILSGLAIAVAAYLIHGGWWLDAGDRVRDTLIVLTVASFILTAFLYRSEPKWHPGRDLWLGFMVGITIILFVTGPGNIFPIVLFVGGAISAAAVLVGYGVGAVLGAAFARTDRSARG